MTKIHTPIQDQLAAQIEKVCRPSHLRVALDEGFADDFTEKGFVITAASGDRLHATFSTPQGYPEEDATAPIGSIEFTVPDNVVDQAFAHIRSFLKNPEKLMRWADSHRRGEFASAKQFCVVLGMDLADKDGRAPAVLHIPVDVVGEHETLVYSTDIPSISQTVPKRIAIRDGRHMSYLLDNSSAGLVDFNPSGRVSVNTFTWLNGHNEFA